MKIVHFADLHIGVESYGKIDPATGFSTRLLDILKALDSLVDFAIGNKADLVLFCGDTYKTRDPSQTQQREFARRLHRLSEAGIPVFLLVGNHDLPNAVGKATAIDIFDTLAVDRVYVGNSLKVLRIPTKSGDIQIVSLPWPKRSSLLSRDDTKNLTIDEINTKIEETISAGLIGITEKLDTSVPTVLAAHITVSNAKSGSEKSMLVGRDPVILLSNLARPEFDYIALGHIHRTQILNTAPPVIYSGSLERLDFSDEAEQKGYYVVDIEERKDNRKVEYEFHPVDARRFFALNIIVEAGDLSPTMTILQAIEKESGNIKDAVVKVMLTLPRTMVSSIRESEIYRALKDAFYVSVGKDFQQDTAGVVSMESIEQLKPLDALKIYLESKKISEERIKILLEQGERLIKEIPAIEG
jgi:DNA repair protein SbcD/Mre11